MSNDGRNPGEGERRYPHLACIVLNILWNFSTTQAVIILLFLNLTVLFPQWLPSRHVFVLDSAEFIDEIYYYGSGPAEIDEQYIKQQWYRDEMETV